MKKKKEKEKFIPVSRSKVSNESISRKSRRINKNVGNRSGGTNTWPSFHQGFCLAEEREGGEESLASAASSRRYFDSFEKRSFQGGNRKSFSPIVLWPLDEQAPWRCFVSLCPLSILCLSPEHWILRDIAITQRVGATKYPEKLLQFCSEKSNGHFEPRQAGTFVFHAAKKRDLPSLCSRWRGFVCESQQSTLRHV